MKRLLLISIVLFIFSCNKTALEGYKNPELSSDERVEDLLRQMSVEEKVVQLQCLWNEKKKLFDTQSQFSIDSAQKYIPNGLGQIGREMGALRFGCGPLRNGGSGRAASGACCPASKRLF